MQRVAVQVKDAKEAKAATEAKEARREVLGKARRCLEKLAG